MTTPEAANIEEIERLVGRLEACGESDVTREARALVSGVLAFHRQGLERLLSVVRESPLGAGLVEALGNDALVASMLVLHGMHPRSIEVRAETIVHKLAREHATLRLIAVEEGVVKLAHRVEGASAALMRRIVEAAIVEALPDALGVTFVDDTPLVMLRRKAP